MTLSRCSSFDFFCVLTMICESLKHYVLTYFKISLRATLKSELHDNSYHLSFVTLLTDKDLSIASLVLQYFCNRCNLIEETIIRALIYATNVVKQFHFRQCREMVYLVNRLKQTRNKPV